MNDNTKVRRRRLLEPLAGLLRNESERTGRAKTVWDNGGDNRYNVEKYLSCLDAQPNPLRQTSLYPWPTTKRIIIDRSYTHIS